jgi:hypothetical protein
VRHATPIRHKAAAERWLSTACGPHASTAASPVHDSSRAVADGVHPAVKSEEAAGLHAVVDGGRREPSAAQLRARHDAVLLGSEHRDRCVIT